MDVTSGCLPEARAESLVRPLHDLVAGLSLGDTMLLRR
jgi:hypothetical protein